MLRIALPLFSKYHHISLQYYILCIKWIIYNIDWNSMICWSWYEMLIKVLDGKLQPHKVIHPVIVDKEQWETKPGACWAVKNIPCVLYTEGLVGVKVTRQNLGTDIKIKMDKVTMQGQSQY